MNSYIALMRGINVGKGRSVPMADLRALAEELGWRAVRSYIQSGNLVFEAEGEGGDLAQTLETALAEHFSFSIPVLVRSAEQWKQLAADRPFAGWSDPKQLSVTLLDQAPDPERWAALAPWSNGDEAIELVGDRVWVKTPSGYGEAKFNNTFLEKKLDRRATTRNRATIDAILNLL